MTTKLEEVARAYAAAWKEDIETYIPDAKPVPSWEEMGEGQRAAMMRCTRKAIEALREPSPGMVEAWSNARPDVTIEDDDERWTDENCARADWNAMTDALLAEKE